MEGTVDAIAQRIYQPNVIANSTLLTVKFISACFTGAVAGILGLDNWAGFVLFLAATLLTTICTYSFNCRGNPGKYLPGGLAELANPGQDNTFAFILVWTLFYGVIHVYD